MDVGNGHPLPESSIVEKDATKMVDAATSWYAAVSCILPLWMFSFWAVQYRVDRLRVCEVIYLDIAT